MKIKIKTSLKRMITGIKMQRAQKSGAFMFFLFLMLALSSPSVHATVLSKNLKQDSIPIVDTDGNPIVAENAYFIKVINRMTGHQLYWRQNATISGNWVDLTFSFSTSSYRFSGEGTMKENQPYKIIYAPDDRYLNYQAANLLYPNGGLYLGTVEKAIYFTLSKASEGYQFLTEKGPLHVNEEKMSMVTEGGTPFFVVQFLKNYAH